MEPASLRYPTCYPRAPKACKPVALQFFSCLNENSTKESPTDTEAANRGLAACVEQMKVYELCMEKLEKEAPPKRFRVQEEYRVNASS